MIEKHDLARMLDKKMVILPRNPDEDYKTDHTLNHLKAIGNAVARTEAFKFCEDFADVKKYAAFKQDVYYNANLLRERGLLQLPSRGVTYFEGRFRFGVEHDKKFYDFDDIAKFADQDLQLHIDHVRYYLTYSAENFWSIGVLAVDTDGAPLTKHLINYAKGRNTIFNSSSYILVPFFKYHFTPKNYCHYYAAHTFINKNPEMPITSPLYRDIEGFLKPGANTPEPIFKAMISGVLEIAEDLVLSTIVLLNTQQAQVRRVLPPVYYKKPHLLKRAQPQDGHTVVTVRKHAEGVGEPLDHPRHSPRKHKRRAHPRTQHYGVGRKLVKAVWIEEQEVGSESEGTIIHDEYRIIRRD